MYRVHAAGHALMTQLVSHDATALSKARDSHSEMRLSRVKVVIVAEIKMYCVRSALAHHNRADVLTITENVTQLRPMRSAVLRKS